jgi:Alw26I/Eco31I/Esp3I family type II restriction endonuclease
MARYGRGTHVAHEKYIAYMEFIVRHDAYSNMPNAESGGRINWQVSSGKTTSFYRFYPARKKWWIELADRLGVPGTADAPGRLALAARLVHPTKERVCRLCGEAFHVGYMYLGAVLARRWNKMTGRDEFRKGLDVRLASKRLDDVLGAKTVVKELMRIFPEREEYFDLLPAYDKFFEETYWIPTNRISPGFMSNPPDRLDGFHDYCQPNDCRAQKDPGRSEENMRSYSVDRRVFEWWSEGDWVVAQALFNSAGAGECDDCGKVLDRVSPDHVGPLSCGFKQIPYFVPLCATHQASKNRRLSLKDVQRLVEYEKKTGESVASFQVRAVWNRAMNAVRNDRDAALLSDVMRSMQDYYMRALALLFESGFVYELTWLLAPEQLAFDVTFSDLDAGKFTYTKFERIKKRSYLRDVRAGRILRVAFESLLGYVSKERPDRKLEALPTGKWLDALRQLITGIPVANSKLARAIQELEKDVLLSPAADSNRRVSALLTEEYYEVRGGETPAVITALKAHFDAVGAEAADYFISAREALEE